MKVDKDPVKVKVGRLGGIKWWSNFKKSKTKKEISKVMSDLAKKSWEARKAQRDEVARMAQISPLGVKGQRLSKIRKKIQQAKEEHGIQRTTKTD